MSDDHGSEDGNPFRSPKAAPEPSVTRPWAGTTVIVLGLFIFGVPMVACVVAAVARREWLILLAAAFHATMCAAVVCLGRWMRHRSLKTIAAQRAANQKSASFS